MFSQSNVLLVFGKHKNKICGIFLPSIYEWYINLVMYGSKHRPFCRSSLPELCASSLQKLVRSSSRKACDQTFRVIFIYSSYTALITGFLHANAKSKTQKLSGILWRGQKSVLYTNLVLPFAQPLVIRRHQWFASKHFSLAPLAFNFLRQYIQKLL
jgi:hypothetical protein